MKRQTYSSGDMCQAKFRWSETFFNRFSLFSHKREDPIVRVQQIKQQTSSEGCLLLIALHFESAHDRASCDQSLLPLVSSSIFRRYPFSRRVASRSKTRYLMLRRR